MRNSLPVERARAENKRDSSAPPKLRISKDMVGERSVGDTSVTVRRRAAYRSENAGMSSVKYVRTIFPESLRFPTEGQSASG